MENSLEFRLKGYKLFVIGYIVFAIIMVSVVNVIFQLMRYLISRGIEKMVSPTIPLNILKRCIDEFEKIDDINGINDRKNNLKLDLKYDCVVFGGGGYKTVQYIGYLMYLLKHDLIDKNTKFIGSSLGSCCSVIAIIAYDIYKKNDEKQIKNNEKLHKLLCYLLQHALESRMNILGIIGNWWHKFEISLKEILFNFNVDINLFNNERLEIVTTAVFPLPSKQIFNRFESKMELLNGLKASCMIPFWSINYPMYYWENKNNYYVDGGFIDLIPAGKSNINLIVYNDTVWYRTFIPFLNEDDYVDDIVKGYLKCNQLAQSIL